MEFPRFNGGDPSAWIFRDEQFFRYYEISREEKVLNASYHLDDEALIWFQDCERSLDSWETFVRAIQVRYDHAAAMEMISRRLEALDNNFKGLQAVFEERLPGMQQQERSVPQSGNNQETEVRSNQAHQRPEVGV